LYDLVQVESSGFNTFCAIDSFI